MKQPTEAEAKDNVDGGKDVSLKSTDNEPVPVEPEEHVKGFHQTVSENFVKEGENPDENALDMSSKQGGATVEGSHESVISDAEWVCESFSSPASGWPSFNTKSYSYPYSVSLSEEEQASVAVLHLQHKALEACQKFLVGDAGSDCDDDEDEDAGEDEDEDELVEDYDLEECEEYKFFERIFTEDVDLRRYYENNQKEGDFYCLVCGGIGKKVWKRFKDCVALIQHSTAILKTKRMRAHRAYAQVICKVVGWDIDQLPAIVLKDLDSFLAASRKLLVEPEKLAASSIDDQDAEPDNPVDRGIDH